MTKRVIARLTFVATAARRKNSANLLPTLHLARGGTAFSLLDCRCAVLFRYLERALKHTDDLLCLRNRETRAADGDALLLGRNRLGAKHNERLTIAAAGGIGFNGDGRVLAS
jgi:hypothetical protein